MSHSSYALVYKDVVKRAIAKEKYEAELSAIALEELIKTKFDSPHSEYYKRWLEDKHANDIEVARLKIKRHAIELAFLNEKLLNT
jgi:hypothetical protein